MQLKNTAKRLLILAILANSVGMFFPLLSSTFSPYYASIAKHIAVTNNWTDLILSGHDWLDKPHLPFWLTAISFKLFGITAFAYILPGFLFNLLGIYYTYRLAKYWYNEEVGMVAALFNATALHLLLSSIDVRAEAFLLGEIMPACYYWLMYNRDAKFKYLLLAATFTALAIMTKGIFILVTIISGIAALWIYQRQWRNFVSLKWLSALSLSLILIAPELIALYYQFDSQPTKVVFGHTHVSGIRWFFWDSQFGRFFNTGPIMSTNPPPFHYLFFVHTFLWAYLPWWPLFFAAVWRIGRNFKHDIQHQDANVYLMASFFITFILFSATKFQVDHYTNIIFPFASIICAKWLIEISQLQKPHPIVYLELIIAGLLLLLVAVTCSFVLTGMSLVSSVSLIIGLVLAMLSLWRQDWQVKLLAYPSLAISGVFIFVMLVNGISYAKYDAGYQIANYLNQTHTIQVVGYDIDLLSLDLHSQNSYSLQDNLRLIQQLPRPFYLVTKASKLAEIKQQFSHVLVLKTVAGASIETFLANVLKPAQLEEQLTKYIVVKIN